MKFKKYRDKKNNRYFVNSLITIIVSFIFAILIINYISRLSSKILLPLAEAETRRYVSIIINKATEEITFDGELFTINRDNDNEIKMITYNSLESTKLINDITKRIEQEFYRLENHGNDDINEIVVAEVPFGVLLNNKLIGNLGPKIKIKMDIIGSVVSELETEVKPYGINNALVEVRVNLDVNARVVIPFVSNEIKINNKIPVSINIINGKIPDSYITSFK